MRKSLLVLALLAFATTAVAQRVSDLNGNHAQLHPTKDKAKEQEPGWAKPGGGGAQNLTNHGGPVMNSGVKTVAIFWGSVWNSGTPASIASELNMFLSHFGSTAEYAVIGQYSNVQTGSNWSHASWVDNSNPPTSVTDAAVQQEVRKYLNQPGSLLDGKTIYAVFLPPGSYASYGSSNSCGGPNLQFCAYHSNFAVGTTDVKYSSLPYPSCSGCQAGGFTDAQDFEHFACHEIREAVTDPDGTAWYDRRGNEADDKCAWSPAPFIGTGGFGYQYEWSNAFSGCVKTR